MGRYEELKRDLTCVGRDGVYHSTRRREELQHPICKQAATAISTLEAEIAELVERLAGLVEAVDDEIDLILCDVHLNRAMQRARPLLSKREGDRS